MRPRTRYSRLGSRPIIRLLAAAFGITLLILWIRGARPGNAIVSEAAQLLHPHSPRNVTYGYPHDVDLPSSYKPSRQKVGKVTYLSKGDDETWVRALQTHEHHNERFGYPMFVLRQPILEGPWSKPAYLLSILLDELRKPDDERLKWLFWADEETVLMNPKIPLEIFLPPNDFPHLHLIATADGNGVNAGAFFIKVHPWSVSLLDAIIAFPAYRPHVELEHHDQTALKELLREKQFKDNYMFVTQRWFNAYTRELYDSRRPWQMKPGDLLVHFPDLPHNEEELHTLLDRSFMHLREFEVDLESTSYSKEIEDFWTSQHDREANAKGEVVKAAEEASKLLKRTASQLDNHRDQLNKDSTGKIESQMAALRLSLRERDYDKEATVFYYDRLSEASKILHKLAARGRDDLVKRAEKAIVSSKEHFIPLNDDLHEDAKVDLLSRQEGLQKILVQSSIDDAKLLQEVQELELMTREMDVMIRERDIGTLT